VPNHQQPAITERFGNLPTLPRTEDYVRRILSLPMFPTLTEAEVRTVADEIKSFFGKIAPCDAHCLAGTVFGFHVNHADVPHCASANGSGKSSACPGRPSSEAGFSCSGCTARKHKESRIPTSFWWLSVIGVADDLRRISLQSGMGGSAGQWAAT
jgi:hypothetical protein